MDHPCFICIICIPIVFKPAISRNINTSDSIIATIGKHVIAQIALTRAGVAIRVNKSANARVVVSGLQVIESSIRIVVIPSVSQGIPQCNVACAGDRIAVGIGDGQELTPRVIIILCNQCAGDVTSLLLLIESV